MIPNVVKTWAPRGQTPVHRHRQGRRDKISVISGISLSPQRHQLGLYYLLFFDNIGQEEVCRFLRELLRHLRGPVIVLLDNSSTHHGKPLHNLLRRHPVSTSSIFPPTPRNSIPMKESGLSPNGTWPIAAPTMLRSWWKMSSVRSTPSAPHRRNCAAVFCNPNFLLFCARLLHSLCRRQ